jgi:replicative DNA helicase
VVRISREIIQYVIIAAAKNEKLLLELKSRINDKCFTIAEILEEYIWKALVDYYETTDSLPDALTLKTNTIRLLLKDEINYDENNLKEFLEYFENDEVSEKFARELALEWLVHRKVVEPLPQKLSEDVNKVVPALDKALEEINSLRFVEDSTESIFKSYEERHESIENIVTLGIPFLDDKFNGGLLPNEVTLLLGPSGVGKTTLSVQIACSCAKYAYANNLEGKVVYVTYEDDKSKIAERVIANLARIPRSRLLKITNPEEQLDRVNPAPGYEHLINRDYAPEYERYHSIKWIDKYLTVLDFSGRSGQPSLGCGGFDEILAVLKTMKQDKIRLILIDWLGVMANRYLYSTNVRNSKDEYIRILKDAPDTAYRKLCKNFDAPVILVHQLAGAVNKLSPNKQVHHSDAEGCKSIAVSAMHCITLGTLDKDSRCRMDITKTRRNKKPDGSVLQLNGNFNEFIDLSNDVIIDSATGYFVSREDFLAEREEEARDKYDDIRKKYF